MDDLNLLNLSAQTRASVAFGELVERFQDLAYARAKARVGEVHLAEDIAQEAFIRPISHTSFDEVPHMSGPLIVARRAIELSASSLELALYARTVHEVGAKHQLNGATNKGLRLSDKGLFCYRQNVGRSRSGRKVA